MRDDLAMERARALADRARRVAPPNPWVGCVLLRDGELVGEGFTAAPGGPHAEAAALAAAGERARGATAVVTLEPCSHHGRTPPCADALIDAGVARVVIALEDPDPQVAGAGGERLRRADIEVVVGIGADEARRQLAPYLHHRCTGRAFCVVKTAMSLDGRTAARDGSSQWITGVEARADAHRLRAESQAVVVGAGTALVDRPSLTARDVDPPVERPPLRVLLDARGRVPAEGPLFDPSVAPTLVITTTSADHAIADAWRAAGAKVELVDVSNDGRGVDLEQTLALLGRLDVLQAMIEGGAHLHGALFDGHLVDRVVAYVAPMLLGDDARPAFPIAGPATIADATRWQLADVTRLGVDVRLGYEPTEERS